MRIFGLLTGSLDPESHACSVQGIDFFLFVVVVIFNGKYCVYCMPCFKPILILQCVIS